MPKKGGPAFTRRSVLRSGAALGAAAGFGGVSLLNVKSGFAADLPDPAKVLADINVGKYVKADYRKQYGLADDEPLWDPKKDWIRTVDWEAVRSEFAGK